VPISEYSFLHWTINAWLPRCLFRRWWNAWLHRSLTEWDPSVPDRINGEVHRIAQAEPDATD